MISRNTIRTSSSPKFEWRSLGGRLAPWICFATAGASIPACTGEVIEAGTDADMEEQLVAPTQQALATGDIKLMSLNLRIDKKSDDDTIGRFAERLPRIAKLISELKIDILAVQEAEQDTWEDLRSKLGGTYDWAMAERSDGERIAIFYNEERFRLLELNHKVFSGADRREANSCPTPPVQKRGDRLALRTKLEDSDTGRILDVFTTHFPSSDGSDIVDCEKVGMAKLLREYVRDFGDNVILLGDFNTGVSSSGNWSEGLEALTKKQSSSAQSYLTETYVATHNMSDGHGFQTTLGDEPQDRTGTKIDHIFVAPAFEIVGTPKIDYSMFDGSTRLDCRTLSVGSSTGIYSCLGQRLDSLDVYSDHRAIISVVRRTDCVKSDCSASR